MPDEVQINSNSILDSIKKMIGLDPSYDVYDLDLITHINSVFVIVNQLGVGPSEPFHIDSNKETWDDFFSHEETVSLVRSYMYLKTKIIFDPPTVGVLHEAMERQISEYEWRLNVQAETKLEEGE